MPFSFAFGLAFLLPEFPSEVRDLFF